MTKIDSAYLSSLPGEIQKLHHAERPCRKPGKPHSTKIIAVLPPRVPLVITHAAQTRESPRLLSDHAFREHTLDLHVPCIQTNTILVTHLVDFPLRVHRLRVLPTTPHGKPMKKLAKIAKLLTASIQLQTLKNMPAASALSEK
jgi:hypothetical protein